MNNTININLTILQFKGPILKHGAHGSTFSLNPGPADNRGAPPPSRKRPQGDALVKFKPSDAADLVQLLGAAERRRDLHGVTELGVVHRVHAVLLADGGHEALPPQDLLRHVGGPGLGGDARGLHHPLQHRDHLQVIVLQLKRRQIIQRAVLVDHVTYDEGGHQEDAVGAHRVIHADVDLVQRHHLALLGGGSPDHLQPHGGADDHAFPQIPDAHHEAQLVVSHWDDCVLAENERLCAPIGLRRFHEDAAEHDGVDEQSDDVLHDKD